ncbi:MAG TPA: VWA domain-containing protein, partial [Acidobacteriota bacterium]|nr:VWA domain-containing protein [Acidobacteriota bacterium]
MRPVFVHLKYCATAGMILLFTLASLDARLHREETVPDQQGRAFRIQVTMVSLPVVVTATDGSHTTGLTMEDFEVYEDGVRQEIAGFAPVEEPISVALMIDSSGSTEAQLSRIKNEAIRFVEQLREDDRVAILSFADQVILLEQFSLFGKKNPGVIRRIKPGGLSAVYEAIWLAVEQVLKPEYGRKALVVLTDGVDTRSLTVTKEETLELAGKTDAIIHSIYFDT